MKVTLDGRNISVMAKAEISTSVIDILNSGTKDLVCKVNGRLVINYTLNSRSRDDQGVEGSLKITIHMKGSEELSIIVEGSCLAGQVRFTEATLSDFNSEARTAIKRAVKKALEEELKEHQDEIEKIQYWLEKL